MKDYPLFIIDRSRRSEASRFSDDFIVCTDKEVGFIARAYKIPKSRRREFAKTWIENPNKYLAKVIGDTTVVIEIVQMLHEPVAHVNRLPPLMRKALKAYLYGEIKAVFGAGEPYDEQIGAVEDVIRMAESQRSRLIDMNGEVGTDRFIAALTAARDGIKLLKHITKTE